MHVYIECFTSETNKNSTSNQKSQSSLFLTDGQKKINKKKIKHLYFGVRTLVTLGR